GDRLIAGEIDDHKLMVPRGDRSGTVIEPLLTDQWFVPFSSHGNQKPDTFKMNAGMLKRSNIELPVFEVVAPKEAYLKGMNKELIARDDSKDLQVGSMKEASTDGNWE
ncbi:MAG: hypothetical protein R6T91_07225, partial [Bacteroidales bacterium]